ncbi:MAG: HAMP domain-containing sensor histidine kinase, partial [Verrucomicrobiaceae bacterium]
PAAFRANLPQLAAYAYVSMENDRVNVRWTSPDSGHFAIEGQVLALRPAMRDAFLRSMQSNPARATGVRWDDSHMLIIQPMLGMGNYPKSQVYLVGWLNLVALCRDADERLVREKIITVAPWHQEAPLPSDAKLYDQSEGDVFWTLVVSRGPNFQAEYGHVAPHFVLIGGCVSAVLLSVLVGLATRANQLHSALSSEREIGRMRSQFVSSVSHEFRTPLSVILSGADLLEAHADQLTPERRGEVFAQIKSSTQRMNEMVGQVLLLGHIESGAMKVKRQMEDVALLCRSIADEVNLATQQRCNLVVDVTSLAPDAATFALDANLLRSALGNLLGNAVKYSAPGATVTLAVQVSAGVARFVVSDQGIGIPAADQARLLEPFHRGRNVGEITGTGLGLAIVERCVKLHGGILSIDSTEDQGTNVVVTIPCA